MRTSWVSLILVVACGGTATTTLAPTTTETTLPTETLTGSIEVQDGMLTEEDPCFTDEGFDDISEGAQVVVRDGNGDVLATTRLGPGSPNEILPNQMWYCAFTFSVDVPATEDFYSVEVSHRGELTYSLAEMEESRWTVALTLG